MSSDAILRALESGLMRDQAKSLSTPERQAVAAYLSGGRNDVASAAVPQVRCGADVHPSSRGPGWNGFGASLTNARFQSADGAGVTLADMPHLRLLWAFGLGDVTNARGQPVVAAGRLFVTSIKGKVYALDPKTGCSYWEFQAGAAVRSGVVVGDTASPAVFFGDAQANLYSVDAATGALLWKVRLDTHPAAMITGAPAYYQGSVYVGVSSFEEVTGADPKYECCTFRGSVAAVDAASGKTLWQTYTIADKPQPTSKSKFGVQRWGPSGASVWSTPTVDAKRNAIYVATGDNYSDPPSTTSDAIFSLDRATGRVLWQRQMTTNDAYTVDCVRPETTNCPDARGPDFDFGQPPILASLASGKQVLVIGQKSGMAHALDPDAKGTIIWQTRVGKGGVLGGMEWGSAVDERNLYVAVSDMGFRSVPDPDHPGNRKGELDPEKGGGLFALDLATGKQVWNALPASCGNRKNCSPAQMSAVSAIPGIVFSGSLDGLLRAYESKAGAVVWDFDTAREYDTLSGQKAHGGAIDASGPAIVGGMVYVYSGYGQWGGLPGNVLLAFGLEGK